MSRKGGKPTSKPSAASASLTPSLLKPHEAVAERIIAQLAQGERLLATHPKDDISLAALQEATTVWVDYTRDLLRTLFTDHSLADEFAEFIGGVTYPYGTLEVRTESVYADVRTYITRLKSLLQRLELYTGPIPRTPVVGGPAQSESRTDVFLVHGHDNEVKESVARFLERLGLSVTILHEQPDQGRTIIEKFEHHADAAYAVVLLTPDDMGAPRDSEAALSPRARQNVILELGYFIGRLGRSRVSALQVAGIESPSDLNGVLYIPLDGEGSWRLRLAGELKAAGLQIDLNRAV